uniref:Transcriptional regulator n=1 Tax=Panagrellus redivivus TaxID=6233 RepID=A0A7E4W8N9_PANRE
MPHTAFSSRFLRIDSRFAMLFRHSVFDDATVVLRLSLHPTFTLPRPLNDPYAERPGLTIAPQDDVSDVVFRQPAHQMSVTGLLKAARELTPLGSGRDA